MRVKLLERSPERDECLRRFHARDPANDGAFLVGVLTTGIYCLPSCTAKKPRDENMRFFADEPSALSAGLRACKRCRPDRFYRGFDPGRELVERLAERVRAAPAEFTEVASLSGTAGVGATKLNELFRVHLHVTPAEFLLRARLDAAAQALVGTRERVLEIALHAGLESSAFHANFLARFGTTPLGYRKLAASDEFVLELPPDFRGHALLSLFGRDAEGVTERVETDRAVKALLLDGRPAALSFDFAPDRVRVRVESAERPSPRAMVQAHASAVRMLALAQDPRPFERLARRHGFARLVRGRSGLRIPLTADLFEGLVWVVVGQQVNLAFASACRSRLIALCGERAPNGMRAHPAPASVARLDYADLEKLQYSRNKARFLIDAARAISEGRLDLEGLATKSVVTIEKALGEIRGLGPWSIRYLLMRSFGFEDCVPAGDAGLEAALERYFGLADRPGPKETERLLEPFAPHRSLATFHFWKSLGDET